MIGGWVLETYKNWIKVRTNNMERILKMTGNVPQKGWYIRIKKGGVSPFKGEEILVSEKTTPALWIIVEAWKITKMKGEKLEIISRAIDQVLKRLGKLPNWFNRVFKDYWKKGESFSKKGVITSEIVAKIFNKEQTRLPERENFGNWFNTFSHPYGIRVYKEKGVMLKIFFERKKVLEFQAEATLSGKKIEFKGFLNDDQITLRLKGDIDDEHIETLRKGLLKYFKEVFATKGGFENGIYV